MSAEQRMNEPGMILIRVDRGCVPLLALGIGQEPSENFIKIVTDISYSFRRKILLGPICNYLWIVDEK